MATVLKVLRIRVRRGRNWQEPYDLDSPVVVIYGPVDTGKTSLLDAIAFVFGRDVEFHGAVDRHLREVEILVRIGSATYTMRRARRSRSVVTVLDSAGTLEGSFPVRKREDGQTLSSWLLQQLRLDDALSAVRLPGGRRLDFPTALLPYCYLTQDDIDRHIIMPPSADQARVAVLKLMFNLTTPEFERAAGVIRDTDNELNRRREQAAVIGDFLEESPATNLAVLDQKIAVLTERQVAAAEQLRLSHGDVRAAEHLGERQRKALQEAHWEWSEAEDKLDKARRAYETASRHVRGYDEALAELAELEARPPWKPGTLSVPLPECPICGGAVPREPPQPGQCYLCGGLRSGVIQPTERTHLQHRRSEAEKERDALEPEWRTAEEAAHQASEKVTRLRRERDLQTAPDVQPYVGAVEAAAVELAAVTTELKNKKETRQGIERLTAMREDIRQLEQLQDERREKQSRDQADLTLPDMMIQHLSEILTGIIDHIGLPHWTGRARIDPETFLPIIDGLGYTQRGGGARSAVSIAYSLALLTYTLEDASARLPTLLMIDSPRKNFGASKSDQELAERLYQRFLDYLETWSQVRVPGREPPVQIIITDNDRDAGGKGRKSKKSERDGIRYHHFDHASGFIRGLSDPHADLGTEPEPTLFEDDQNDELEKT